MKRALVLKGGTMKGAFVVGALKAIHNKLEPGYFDAIFSTSVGVFEQAFFASGQVYFMENTWKEYVHGRQLINPFINPFNPLRGRAILDLDYLVDLFQSNKSKLDIPAMKNSPYKLINFVMDYETGEIVAMDLKENDVFQVMKATCALPYAYPKKVMINGRRYLDSWIAPNEKFKKVLEKELAEYDEVIAIVNNEHFDEVLGDLPNYIIRPSIMPLLYSFDTNRERLTKTIEQGEIDAGKYLNSLSNP